jgi:hypothetical protein
MCSPPIIKIDLALDVSLYTFYRFCQFTLLRKPLWHRHFSTAPPIHHSQHVRGAKVVAAV